MTQLNETQKEQLKEQLEKIVGTEFTDGIHAQQLTEVNFRDYEQMSGETGTIIKITVYGNKFKVGKFLRNDLKMHTVKQVEHKYYSVHLKGSVVENLL